MRLISGRLDDGRLLAVAALRPAGASGHGEEIVVGALGSADGFEQLTETLLSTEYGADGAPTRVGLELYPSSDGLAVRVAGTAGAPVLGAGRRNRTSLGAARPARRGRRWRRRPRRPAQLLSMAGIRALISDFGGVLTTPLIGSFAAFQDRSGISTEALGRAMQAIADRDGAHPLFELETGT